MSPSAPAQFALERSICEGRCWDRPPIAPVLSIAMTTTFGTSPMGSLGKILHHFHQQAEGARQRFLQRILPLLRLIGSVRCDAAIRPESEVQRTQLRDYQTVEN